MAKTVEQHTLPPHRLGTWRSVAVHRYGHPGAGPKVHIQAGLHAGEVPGMLVAHHLIRRLDAAEAEGAIRGEIAVIPVCNPIGLDQMVGGTLIGRFALDTDGNFNRHFPDPVDRAAAMLQDRLTGDGAADVTLVRAALRDAVAEVEPVSAVQALRKLLLGLAIDADVVLDLHCDSEAVLHLYTAPELWPDAEPLAALLGARAVLLAADSGGEPFDESCSTPWWRLRGKLDAPSLPPACFATTVELRGTADVDDAVAAGDADNVFRYLQHRGAVAGNPGPLPPLRCAPTPLEGVERLRAPVPGVIAYRCPVGTPVRPGQVVADIVDPTAADPAAARVPVTATTAGILWARRRTRIAGANDIVASVAGSVPIQGKGRQLLTS